MYYKFPKLFSDCIFLMVMSLKNLNLQQSLLLQHRLDDGFSASKALEELSGVLAVASTVDELLGTFCDRLVKYASWSFEKCVKAICIKNLRPQVNVVASGIVGA